MPLTRRVRLLSAALLSGALLTTACSGAPDDPDVLVIYNAQHEDLMKVLTDAFTAKTGIEVESRKNQDNNLANLLTKEQEDTPADVFVTENSPAMATVNREGLFAPLPPAALEAIPEQFVAADKTWGGFAARSTAFVYDPDDFTQEADFPASMLDLMKPEWKGRFGYAPQGADFQAIIAAVYALEGEQTGDAFVQALKDNGTVYASNFAVMQAVHNDQIDAGVIYHYYWYKDRAAGGGNSSGAELRFFKNQDPGAFLSISGIGILKSTNLPDQARQFVEFVTGPEGQQALADSNALEYPVASDIDAAEVLTPIAELEIPDISIADLDGLAVIEQLREVGIL